MRSATGSPSTPSGSTRANPTQRHPQTRRSRREKADNYVDKHRLRGVYQIYSDHGFLSNQVAPKETIIGETFYDDDDTAQGIHDYLQTYDGFNGGRIGLRGVLEWPLARPVGCAHAANVQPPYTADEYLQFFDTVFANGFE